MSVLKPQTPKMITVIVPNNGTVLLYNAVTHLKDEDVMPNTADLNQAAPLGLHALFRPIIPSIKNVW